MRVKRGHLYMTYSVYTSAHAHTTFSENNFLDSGDIASILLFAYSFHHCNSYFDTSYLVG